MPAKSSPVNTGIVVQTQKGVIAPVNAAKKLPKNLPLFCAARNQLYKDILRIRICERKEIAINITLKTAKNSKMLINVLFIFDGSGRDYCRHKKELTYR
jgi:hypothetical protein